MKIIDLTCPKCAANITVNSTATRAKCQYCGAEFLIDRYNIQEKVAEQQKKVSDDGTVHVGNAAPSNTSQSDENWGKLISAVLGLGHLKSKLRFSMFRLERFLLSLFWMVAAGALGYYASALVPAAYVSYALVAAGVMVVCGIIMLAASFKSYKGVVFGFGIGVIAGYYPMLVQLVQNMK